jgi:hypothetical protein
MASSAVSPVLRAPAADDGNSSAPPTADSYPVPADWILAEPADHKRRILALLEQGDRDIAANRGRDAEEVFREADELIAAVAQPAQSSARRA